MLLCVDFASKKVKLTGVEREKESLRVAESLEFDVSDLAHSLGEYLQAASRNIDEIRVSGALENTFHRIFVIPDLKGKMFQQALETEVTKAFSREYQFKCQDLGEVPGPGNKVNKKMMTTGMKINTLEELSQMFAKSRVKPRILTTYPAALQALARELNLLSEESLGFLDLDYPTSRIVIFKGDEIRLTREVNVLEEEKDPDRSALATDIYRTLLFYTENYPNQMVTKLVFSGNSATTKCVNILTQKTGAQVVPFLPETIFHGITEIPPIHPGCLGLALLDPGSFDFGFVPFSVQGKKKVKKILTLSSSFALGIILILGLAISRLSLNLENLAVYDGGIKGKIRMKEDRLKELDLEFVSHSIETSQPPWSEILLEMAAAVPTGVILESFSLKNAKKIWRGEITGLAEGSDEISSLLLVERVQSNFNKSPLFKGVKLTDKELQGKKVEFKISYQLNM